jgi:hypothetical protein
MHFFFKIFFIFIFFRHIIYVRRKNGGVKCRCLVGFLAFLLFVPRFPRPPPLQICGGALHFLRDEVSAVQAKRQPLGLFFLLFLVLLYIFLLIFNASFVYFVQFSFGFSF